MRQGIVGGWCSIGRHVVPIACLYVCFSGSSMKLSRFVRLLSSSLGTSLSVTIITTLALSRELITTIIVNWKYNGT